MFKASSDDWTATVQVNLPCLKCVFSEFQLVVIINIITVAVITLNFFFFFFFFFFLFRAEPSALEALRLGVQLNSELPTYTTATRTPDPSCACDPRHSSWQCWILNPLIQARDQTCILMDTGRMCALLEARSYVKKSGKLCWRYIPQLIGTISIWICEWR